MVHTVWVTLSGSMSKNVINVQMTFWAQFHCIQEENWDFKGIKNTNVRTARASVCMGKVDS